MFKGQKGRQEMERDLGIRDMVRQGVQIKYTGTFAEK